MMNKKIFEDWGNAAKYKMPGIAWIKLSSGPDRLIYSAAVNNQPWHIRLNDFPDEPLYTLIVDGTDVVNFNDWPNEWMKPQ